MNSYQFNQIARQMQKKMREGRKGPEERYMFLLFPMESNLLKVHPQHPGSPGHAVSRDDTSPRIARLFESARGGVLFIDEAGALIPADGRDDKKVRGASKRVAKAGALSGAISPNRRA